MRLIDADALVDALMTYTWKGEDERTIDDADEKREYIKGWLPNVPTVEKKDSEQADFEKVVCHLQIIRTWAEVDRKYGGIHPDCCEHIVKWIDEALELLKGESNGNRK